MKKAVLLSLKPKWCELVFLQRKTLEVRKSRPSIETPFKVYIYETRAKWVCYVLRKAGMTSIAEILENGFGKVVGEFICDYIVDIGVPYPAYFQEMDSDILKQSCLTYYDIHRYAGTRNVYGWHISNLRIYDTPKPLSDFKRWNRTEENAPCAHTYPLYAPCETCKECNLTRAPQSYCFVEELP